MRKFKCEVCTEWHGGFHLCVGPTAMKDHPELKKGTTIYRPEAMSKADAARKRWENERRSTRERDNSIAHMYVDQGMSAREIAEALDMGVWKVRTALKNVDVPMRRPGDNTKNHLKELT